MFKSFRIGSLFGIPIKLDVSFLLILPVFAWLIGAQIELLVGPLNAVFGRGLDAAALTAGSRPWILGLTAAIGLFVGVVLHELGHSLVAIRYGYPIDSITLWIFGGLAQLTDQPEDWKQEFLIAIAGPIVSVLVGIGSYLLLFIVPSGFDGAVFVLAYLALLNVALAGFNMLPAFPMDGGRVLRALLARNRPFARATQIAAEVGKLFALLMGLFGLLQLNVILIGIAFFVYIAASGEAQQTVLNAAFEGVRVEDIMTSDEEVDSVSPETSVADLLERMFSERHTGYPVMENGRLAGIVTLSDAREVEPVERDAYTVDDVMTTELETIAPDAEAMEALNRMQQLRIGRLLVLEDDRLVGLISRTDLMTALNIIKSSGSIETSRRATDDPGRSARTSNPDRDGTPESDRRWE
ncbi:M50 family metallopeptidase [Halalkalicoccus jeotgali]|uniref:Zinc metalloprotease n=1 Tax=Halalkalicoccus jeotgali (strain DSM 18796 / CECT 7217 / JCM 14584 / KCTC 4019 / B3) TaxID=795797 RepID=D8J5U0_HALJB|nr:M50 family metallopeptidase [Halalkalicoccus jeotgali]ADJ13746.1 peptidase M50 [Halalkalicoccus jeotgali B3]ELY34208.1 peptidase M50 [Halalkalicoccus jeotgali B3]